MKIKFKKRSWREKLKINFYNKPTLVFDEEKEYEVWTDAGKQLLKYYPENFTIVGEHGDLVSALTSKELIFIADKKIPTVYISCKILSQKLGYTGNFGWNRDSCEKFLKEKGYSK